MIVTKNIVVDENEIISVKKVSNEIFRHIEIIFKGKKESEIYGYSSVEEMESEYLEIVEAVKDRNKVRFF